MICLIVLLKPVRKLILVKLKTHVISRLVDTRKCIAPLFIPYLILAPKLVSKWSYLSSAIYLNSSFYCVIYFRTPVFLNRIIEDSVLIWENKGQRKPNTFCIVFFCIIRRKNELWSTQAKELRNSNFFKNDISAMDNNKWIRQF